MTTSYLAPSASAHDEADELRRWASLGLEAARRAAEAEGEAEGKGAKTGEGASVDAIRR